MAWIPLFSNRRPLKHRIFLVATLLLLLAGPATMHRIINIGVGGVFEIDVANGLVQLNAPAVSSAEFRIQSMGYEDAAISTPSRYLLPHAEWYGGLHVQIPSWILVCIAFAFYRRTQRRYEAAIKDAGWCRSCGSTLKTPDARCSQCGHDGRLHNRISVVRWIASGMRQDVVFVGGRGDRVFRAILATSIFVVIFVMTGYSRITNAAFESLSEYLARTIPSLELFVPMFAVTFLAWALTRIVLVMVFVDRPFSTPTEADPETQHSVSAT